MIDLLATRMIIRSKLIKALILSVDLLIKIKKKFNLMKKENFNLMIIILIS